MTHHLILFQQKVAIALGVPANRIISRVKRLGGGFGGKISHAVLKLLPAVIAANKYACT